MHRRIVREWERAVEAYAGHILVEDASGCRFRLYEYHERRLLSNVARYELDTGEAVQRQDVDNYVIEATGETLLRVTQ